MLDRHIKRPTSMRVVVALWFGVVAACLLATAGRAADAGQAAVILTKTETLHEVPYEVVPAISHAYAMTARLDTPSATGAGDVVNLDVTAVDFDRLHIGDRVNIQVAQFGPFRTAHLSGVGLRIPWQRFTALVALLARLMSAAAVIGLIAIAFLRVRWRILCTAVIVLAAVLDLWALHGAWSPHPQRGTARIIAISRVANVHFHWRSRHRDSDMTLLKPYDEVEMVLKPAPDRDPVRLVDRVDANSVGVRVGQDIPVAFDPAFSREARIVGGDRSYGVLALLTQALHVAGKAVFGALLLGGLCLWLIRARKPKAAPRSPSAGRPAA